MSSLPPRILYSRAVIVDTGAFLAFANPRDEHHVDAVDCFNNAADDRLPLFASLPTLYEAHRRILFDLGVEKAMGFLDSVSDGSINLIRTSCGDERNARLLLDHYRYMSLTLTDAVNMAVMTRLGVAVCFTFDNHFLRTGFIRIPPYHLSKDG